MVNSEVVNYVEEVDHGEENFVGANFAGLNFVMVNLEAVNFAEGLGHYEGVHFGLAYLVQG